MPILMTRQLIDDNQDDAVSNSVSKSMTRDMSPSENLYTAIALPKWKLEGRKI